MPHRGDSRGADVLHLETQDVAGAGKLVVWCEMRSPKRCLHVRYLLPSASFAVSHGLGGTRRAYG